MYAAVEFHLVSLIQSQEKVEIVLQASVKYVVRPQEVVFINYVLNYILKMIK
ncbi:MAG: hypothetical protein WC125_04445 [Bacteroidales bacterium]